MLVLVLVPVVDVGQVFVVVCEREMPVPQFVDRLDDIRSVVGSAGSIAWACSSGSCRCAWLWRARATMSTPVSDMPNAMSILAVSASSYTVHASNAPMNGASAKMT